MSSTPATCADAIANSTTRYAPQNEIGKGAFSVVVAATDKRTNKKVALKRIAHVFDDPVFAKHVLRELKMLKHLKHPNIIPLTDVVVEKPSDPLVNWMADPIHPHIPAHGSPVSSSQKLLFVSDFMDTDMHSVVQSSQNLSLKHIQFFMYQIIRGVDFLHRSGILHRDLKPENILVNRDCHLKICDLGLARFNRTAYTGAFLASNGPSIFQQDAINSGRRPRASSFQSELADFTMTERVVTRWYRAPEVILSMGKYSYPLDMWSVGCIFA
jgi:mitogen-activated protein kinase 1/3